MLWRARRDSNP